MRKIEMELKVFGIRPQPYLDPSNQNATMGKDGLKGRENVVGKIQP